MPNIAENIRAIRENMAQAAKSAGRSPEEILLCAATKMNDAEAVREAVAAGVTLSPARVREKAMAVVTTPRCRATSAPTGVASHAAG